MLWIIIVTGLLVLAKAVAMWVEQKSLYFPVRGIAETPRDIRIFYEDLRLETRDRQHLHAWYIPAPESEQAVLFCHGNAGNLSGRLHRVAFFRDVGVNLLIFDYRGYGNSSGRPREKGLYRDVQAAYDHLVQVRGIRPGQIMVYGKSLGCALAVELALRHPVGSLVLESPFASVRQVVKETYFWEPLTWLTSQRFDSLAKIGRVAAPKLILHGRYDDMIGFNHAAMLHAAACPPKRLLPYDGGHNDMDYVTSKAHQETIRDALRLMEKESA